MGHHHSDLDDEGKKMSHRFNPLEFDMLKKSFKDLARRSDGDFIDKDTFLQFFPLPGLLGERLFDAFDSKKKHAIDFEDFVKGIARLNRGTWEEQLRFVFKVFDADASGAVSREELRSLLNSLPMELMHKHAPENMSPSKRLEMADGAGAVEHAAGYAATFEEEAGLFLDEVDTFTNNDLVEQAFRECDFDHDEELSFDQFKTWVLNYPIILNIMQSVLPYAGQPMPHHDDHGRHHHHHWPGHHSRRQSAADRKSDRLASLPFHRQFHSNGSFNGRRSHPEITALVAEMHPPESGSRSHSDEDHAAASAAAATKKVNPYEVRARLGSFDTNNSTIASVDVHSLSGGMPAPRAQSDPFGGASSPLANGSPGLSPLRFDSAFKHRRQRSGSMTCIDLRGIDNEHQVRNLVLQARNLTRVPEVRTALTDALHALEDHESRQQGEPDVDDVAKEGFLYKRGQHLHIWKQRWYLLSNNMLYYYAHKSDVRSRGVIFLTGCIVEKLEDDHEESHGYYGFEILSTYGNFRRVLFATTAEQRDAWIHDLQHAAQVVPIEEDFALGGILGQGRFSHVLNCYNKHTKENFAVKVIEKSVMDADERELLRTEIAIMKLVNHPHIIRMEAVYEDKEKIYIVMEKLEGGELFSRIVGRPTFSEEEAYKVMKPLVESVAYLHDLGIVHRDLKPENILCGENLEDLKIADFGLSKLVLPTDVMKMPCGTLSYVAPEVLTLTGYGKETDIWSLGVIMFLLLRGKLPFDGEDREEIIDRTINANLKKLMAGDKKWSRLSPEAQDLMSRMLEKAPKNRISARGALRHPWMEKYRCHNPECIPEDEAAR